MKSRMAPLTAGAVDRPRRVVHDKVDGVVGLSIVLDEVHAVEGGSRWVLAVPGDDSHENFVVNQAASDYVVNFVVNPLGRLRSLDWIVAGITGRGYPDRR